MTSKSEKRRDFPTSLPSCICYMVSWWLCLPAGTLGSFRQLIFGWKQRAIGSVPSWSGSRSACKSLLITLFSENFMRILYSSPGGYVSIVRGCYQTKNFRHHRHRVWLDL